LKTERGNDDFIMKNSDTASIPLVGQEVRCRDLGAVKITETTYASNLVIADHCHRFPYFCAVIQGAFTDFSGTRQRWCRPTTIFFRPSEQVHADRFEGAGAHCMIAEIRPALIDRLGLSRSFLTTFREFSGGPIFSLAGRLLGELKNWDDFSALSVEALVLELMCQAGRSAATRAPAASPWLRMALEVVEAQYREPIALADVAEVVRVHPTHLARAFRAAYGCSVGDYLRRKRIEQCCERLARADLPLLEVALEAGFSDQSHFSRVFKRVVGESPGAYRRRVLKAR